jgi:hypothetical protein
VENEEQSIVEQEVEVVAEAVGTRLRLILDWLQANILTLESIYQIAAIALALFLSWLLHRRFKRVLERVSR